ncbi:30S ribosomal protein S16 [candidate division KSB1 bacterium]|nr:30S ribosomal protein S16 [candidate division KSB1 bacterium]
MSVRLRLARMGRKKVPFYRIVAIDSRKWRDGSYIDKIGFYNPLTEPADVEIDKAKAIKWLDDGAIPSDTVKNLFRKAGIWLEWNLKKSGKSPQDIEQELEKWRATQIERERRREAKEAMEKRAKEAEKKSQKVEEPAEAEPEKAQATATEPKAEKKSKVEEPAATEPEEVQAAVTEPEAGNEDAAPAGQAEESNTAVEESEAESEEKAPQE